MYHMIIPFILYSRYTIYLYLHRWLYEICPYLISIDLQHFDDESTVIIAFPRIDLT